MVGAAAELLRIDVELERIAGRLRLPDLHDLERERLRIRVDDLLDERLEQEARVGLDALVEVL